MAITYSDEKKAEWEEFKRFGGEITFEIDATDINRDRSFERLPSIAPLLKTGFEIPPTSLIDSPELQALVQLHGSEWDYIFCRIYLAGGSVEYKQNSNGKYDAKCKVKLA